MNPFGFTLIELMIVVAVLGLLVSLSIPQYKKYQRKAHQSEAKIALGAIFGLEKSFYSEYSGYIWAFDAFGYSPEGSRRFYTLSCSDNGTPTSGVDGYTGAATTCVFNTQNSPYASNGIPVGNPCSVMQGVDWVQNSQIFVFYADGNLGALYDDRWTISETKNLYNCSLGY